MGLFGIAFDFLPGLVGVARERISDAASHAVILLFQLKPGTVPACPPDGKLPGTHKGVLHQGQLVGTVARIVDNGVDQALLEGERPEGRAVYLARPGDGLLHLTSVKPGDEELAAAHRLR
jgi:hypothetical protein